MSEGNFNTKPPKDISLATRTEFYSLEHRVTSLEGAVKMLDNRVGNEVGALGKELKSLHDSFDTHFKRAEELSRQQVEATVDLSKAIKQDFREMVSAVLGIDRMPTKVVNVIIRIFAGIVTALVFILVFALTGVKLNWFPHLVGGQ